MNNKLGLASPIALGGVEAAKQLYQGNKLFSAEDWNTYVRSGEVQNYVTLLNEFSKGNKADALIDSYQGDLSLLTPEQRLTMMANEIYGDRFTPVTKTTTKEDGSTEEYETTEYAYNRQLLQNQLDNLAYQKVLENKQAILDNMSFWERVGNDFKALGTSLAGGMMSVYGNFTDLMQGMANVINLAVDDSEVYKYAPEESSRDYISDYFKAIGNAFRKPFLDKGWDEQATDWLKSEVFKFEEEKLSVGAARYFYSVGDSVGRMLPSMILNGVGSIAAKSGAKAGGAIATVTSDIQTGIAGSSQLVYYTSMAAGNMQEMFRDPNLATRPTLEIVANSSLRAALELGVEKALGKIMDNTTALDQLSLGYKPKTQGKLGARSAVTKMLKDAFQEGMEEVLQDFSGYLVNRVCYAFSEKYEETAQWSAQGVIDAFVLGAVMSIAGSGIRWATTKRIDSGIVATDKNGNILYNKDGSVKTKKYSKLTSMGYIDNLQNMYQALTEAGDTDLSADERKNAVLQAYKAARIIGDLYGEFGQQRFDQALAILQSIDESQDYQEVATKEIESAIREAAKDYSDNRVKELVERAKSHNMRGNPQVVEGNPTVSELTENYDFTEQQAKVVKGMFEGGVESLVVTDQGSDVIPSSDGKTIIVSKNIVDNSDPDTILRTAAERNIAADIAKNPELASTLSVIHKIAQLLIGKETTMEQAIYRLLFDDVFQSVIVYNGDKNLINIIAHIDQMYAEIELDKSDISRAKQIRKHQLEIIRQRLSNVLFNFFLGNDQYSKAYIESLDILSADQKRKLRAANWQNGVYQKVMVDGGKLNKDDLRMLDTRIEYAAMNTDKKQQIKDLIHSNKISDVKQGLRELNNHYQKMFEGVYNDVTYKRYDGTIAAATFNAFLMQHGVTIQTLTTIPTDEVILTEIREMFGKIDENTTLRYWRTVFERSYGYTFNLDIDLKTGQYTVASIKQTPNKQGETRIYSLDQGIESNRPSYKERYDKTGYTEDSIETLFVKSSTRVKYPIFNENLNKTERALYTIDDVIKDPSLLSYDIQDEIAKRNGGTIDAAAVYLYLRNYYLDKSNGKESVVIDENGDYYIASVDPNSAFLNKNGMDTLYKKANEARQKIDKTNSDAEVDLTAEFQAALSANFKRIFGEENLTKKDFKNEKEYERYKKNLSKRLPRFVLTPMTNMKGKATVIDSDTIAYYDQVSNTIYFNSNYSDLSLETMRFYALHELRHAIQYHNGLAMGFDNDWLADINKSNKAAAKTIVDDMKAHMPDLYNKSASYAKDVERTGDILYILSSGEAEAYGFSNDYYNYPFVVQRNSIGQVSKILTPWGSEYTLSGVNGVVTKSKAISVSKRGILADIPGTNIPTDIQAVYADIPKLENLGSKATSEAQYLENMSYNQRVQELKEIRSQYNLKYTDEDIAESFKNTPDGYRRRWYINSRPNVSYATFDKGYALISRDITKLSTGAIASKYSTDNIEIAYNQISNNMTGKNEQFVQPAIVKTSDVSFSADGTVSVKKIVQYASKPIPVTKGGVGFESAVILSSNKYSEFYTKVYDKVVKSGLDYKAYTTQLRNFGNLLDTNTLNDIREGTISRDAMERVAQKGSQAIVDSVFKGKKDGETWCGMTRSEFAIKASIYARAFAICEINKPLYNYMWNSGYMTAKDTRFKTAKEELTTFLNSSAAEAIELRKAMKQVAWFQTAPMVSYETFLNMDIPFIRLTSRTESIDTGFNGVTLAPGDGKVQEGLAKGHPNKVAKLYAGVVKGKDILGGTTSSESEGLIPSRIVQAADIYTVKLDPRRGLMLLDSNRSDFERQLVGTIMMTPDKVDVDKTFSFAKRREIGEDYFENNTSRIVTNNVAENTNLQYYVGKKGSGKPSKIQMNPDMQYFITSVDLQSLDPKLAADIRNATFRTQSDVGNYLERFVDTSYVANSYETNYTIAMLAGKYYRNPYFANMQNPATALLDLVKSSQDIFSVDKTLKFIRENYDLIESKVTVEYAANKDLQQQVLDNIDRLYELDTNDMIVDTESISKLVYTITSLCGEFVSKQYAKFAESYEVTYIDDPSGDKDSSGKPKLVQIAFSTKTDDLADRMLHYFDGTYDSLIESVRKARRSNEEHAIHKYTSGDVDSVLMNKETGTTDIYFSRTDEDNFAALAIAVARDTLSSDPKIGPRYNKADKDTQDKAVRKVLPGVKEKLEKMSDDKLLEMYKKYSVAIEQIFQKEDTADATRVIRANEYRNETNRMSQSMSYMTRQMNRNTTPEQLAQFLAAHPEAKDLVTLGNGVVKLSLSATASSRTIATRMIGSMKNVSEIKTFVNDYIGRSDIEMPDTQKFLRTDWENLARSIIRKLGVEDIDTFVKDNPELANSVSTDSGLGSPKMAPTSELEKAQATYEARKAQYDRLTALYEAFKNEVKSDKKLAKEQAKKVTTLEQKVSSQANVIADLQQTLAEARKAAKRRAEVQTKEVVVTKTRVMQLGDVKFTSKEDVKTPDKLKPLLTPIFDRTAPTQVKYLSGESESHPVKSYEEFVKNHADYLAEITEYDIDPILDFLANVNVSYDSDPDAITSYHALREFMLLYLYKVGTTYNDASVFTLTKAQQQRIENMFKNIKSTSGTELRISQVAQEVIHPGAYIAASLARKLNIEFDDEDLDALDRIASTDYSKKYDVTTEKGRIAAAEAKVKDLQDVQQRMMKKTLAKMKNRKPDSVFDKLWAWQRMAMLTAPGTWVRNITSNIGVQSLNWASDQIGNWIFKGIEKKAVKNETKFGKALKDQYRLVGTKVTSDVSQFIENDVIGSGFMDLVGEGLLKQDTSSYGKKGSNNNAELLSSLIASGVRAEIYRTTQFEGKTRMGKLFAKAGNELMGLLYGWTDKNGKKHEGVLSDNKYVNKAFKSYLGKMLTEDIESGRINLANGLNDTAVVETIANAYVMASWDYMHRTNFFTDIENLIREKAGAGAFYMYKQFTPFAVAGWNWFLKGLDYSPVGLVKGIVDMARLENTIAKMKVQRTAAGEKVTMPDGTVREGLGKIAPSERFAYYLARRRIGSGIIGTAAFVTGAVLAAFGKAGIEDDDGSPKLYVGNISVDISNVFGTSGLLAGIACVSAIQQAVAKEKNALDAILDVFLATMNQLFEDTVYADMVDILQGNDSVGDVIMTKLSSIPATFVPNIIRTTMSYITPVRTKYSSGFVGILEKMLVAAIPVAAYLMPKRRDPYTGELQYKYNMAWNEGFWGVTGSVVGTSLNYASPVKVSRRTVSEIEKTAIANNVTRGELTGRYSDIGKLSNSQNDKLNEYYGILNKQTLEQFMSNKKKFTVEDKNGKRVELSYNAMTTEQRKSVIDRIMTNNAKIAKIYVATSELGYKYYTKSESEYNTLKALGIKGVIYSEDKKEGFKK